MVINTERRTLADALGVAPRYVAGEPEQLLRLVGDGAVDCVLTQLPTSITLNRALDITGELFRALARQGSLWLHVSADKDASLATRLAGAMQLNQGWRLANTIAWRRNVGRGNDFMNVVHPLFHFVKADDYYFDGSVLAATVANVGSTRGSSGNGYRRKIDNSKVLNSDEKREAMAVLDDALARRDRGEISNFRLFLRESKIPLGDDSERGRSINSQGYFLHVSRILPSNLWEIAIERDKKSRLEVVPPRLARRVIYATCPPGGIVLDPMCKTGNTCRVAVGLGRRAIGFDWNEKFINELNAEQQIQARLF